jgi:hypothetical protein
MFKAIKEFFFGKPAEATVEPTAPYKVETPVVVSTVVVDASLDNKPHVVAVAASAVKRSTAPRAKKPAAAAKTSAAKKPTAPRSPKV